MDVVHHTKRNAWIIIKQSNEQRLRDALATHLGPRVGANHSIAQAIDPAFVEMVEILRDEHDRNGAAIAKFNDDFILSDEVPLRVPVQPVEKAGIHVQLLIITGSQQRSARRRVLEGESSYHPAFAPSLIQQFQAS